MAKRIPLSDAALRLGLTYHQVRERVFRGELAGGRDQYGRFYVEADTLPVTPVSSESAESVA